MSNTSTIKMCAWVKISNSHGLIGYEPIWLPNGEKPKKGDIADAEKYKRALGLDFEMKGKVYE